MDDTTLTIDQLIAALVGIRKHVDGNTPVVLAHVEEDWDYDIENRFLDPISVDRIDTEEIWLKAGGWSVDQPQTEAGETGEPHQAIVIGDRLHGTFDHLHDTSFSNIKERRDLVLKLAAMSQRRLTVENLTEREQVTAEDLEDENIVECQYDEESGGVTEVRLLPFRDDLTPTELDAYLQLDNQPDKNLPAPTRNMAWHLADMGLISRDADGVWKHSAILNDGSNWYLKPHVIDNADDPKEHSL